jgi:uncharacterized membrane protein YeaQ/YmgE (transglycosylase-associated protein family)
MHIIGTFLTGLVVGIVAKLLMPGRDPGGFIITALLGIAGAFVAKFLGQQLGWYRPEDAAGFIASVAGAVLLLFLYRVLFISQTKGAGTAALTCDGPAMRSPELLKRVDEGGQGAGVFFGSAD